MGLLKLVSSDETVRIDGEDGDFLVVKAHLSKREMNAIVRRVPTASVEGEDISVEMVLGTSEALFETLVVGWSLDVPPTVDNYLSLSPEAAAWVDEKLFEHFNNAQLSKDELGKPSTSPKGQQKATRDET